MALKREGWQLFLQTQGVWDETKTEDDLYIRYLKLHDKTFPAVPAAAWPLLYQCITQLEDCFIMGEAMGVVHEHPFMFEVVDPTPFAQVPMQAAPAVEDWLWDKVARDCKIGHLCRIVRGKERDPTFVSNMILVPKQDH